MKQPFLPFNTQLLAPATKKQSKMKSNTGHIKRALFKEDAF